MLANPPLSVIGAGPFGRGHKPGSRDTMHSPRYGLSHSAAELAAVLWLRVCMIIIGLMIFV